MRSMPVFSLVFLAGLALGGCPLPECFGNDGCADGFCAEGRCVACLSASDCEAGALCCEGACVDAEVEERCGCAAELGGAPGAACGAGQVCLALEARASPANVAEGSCGCPCEPALGGALCQAAPEGEGGFTCGCDRQDAVATCEAPSLDEQGRPHKAADTCTPDSTCTCFAAGAACQAGDCTSAGCIDLLSSATDCGVAGRSCTEEATGISDTGICVQGGCTCDLAADCRGAGLNVDSCQFVGDEPVTRCVCADYAIDGVAAPCPLGLACVDGGCAADDRVYADEASLISGLRAR